MSASNFFPAGQTILANAGNVSATVTVTSDIPVNKFLVVNAGAADVYFRLSTNANVTATVPITSNTSAPGQLINAGDSYIIGFPIADFPNTQTYASTAYVAANSFPTTGQLYITPIVPGGV